VCALDIVLGLIVGGVFLAVFLMVHGDSQLSPDQWIEKLAERPLYLLGLLSLTLFTALFVALGAAFLSPVRWVCRLRLTTPSISASHVASGAIGAVAMGMVFTMAYGLGFLPRSS